MFCVLYGLKKSLDIETSRIRYWFLACVTSKQKGGLSLAKTYLGPH
jgi:hypothetical protein